MKNINHKRTKIQKKRTTLPILISTILILITAILLFKIFNNNLFSSTTSQSVITLKDYNYYLPTNSTTYQKQLFKDLKTILTQEEINEKEYAITLAKLFLADLFTLDNKTSSADVSSCQYVYTNYQEDYRTLIQNTLYSHLIVNTDNNRNQTLPIVTNIKIISLTQSEYIYQEEILDDQAYHITAQITYKKNLNYPTKYNLIIAKNNNILQVVQSEATD